jgi:hypothetical protein
MTSRFKLKNLFTEEEITNLVQNFGFKRMNNEEIIYTLQSAFSDYIIGALSEMTGDPGNDQKIYIEAAYHLNKASKLLEGMPHPAGKMSFRLGNMLDTLNKLIEGRSNLGAERASRFMEKNLVRKLRDLWVTNTSTPFHPYGDGSGRNPRDFILHCFSAANKQYPTVAWFSEVDYTIADVLIKGIKR